MEATINERIESRVEHDYDTINKNLVTIVLPCLNEELAIGRVVNELKTEGYNNILVIDRVLF